MVADTFLYSIISFTYFLFSLYSLLAPFFGSSSRKSKISDSESPVEERQQPWEMIQIPVTPGTTGGLKSPATPRTMAFNTLSGDRRMGMGKSKGKGKKAVPPLATQTTPKLENGELPLRHHIAMGDETYQGSNARR